MSERERDAMIKECFAYDEGLCKNGHMIGEALQSARNAAPPCAGKTAKCP